MPNQLGAMLKSKCSAMGSTLVSTWSALVSKWSALASTCSAFVAKCSALASKWRSALVSGWSALVSGWSILVSKWSTLVSKCSALASKWRSALVSGWSTLVSRWSILVAPAGDGRHRRFDLPFGVILAGAGAVVVLLGTALFVAVGGEHRIQARQLAAKNQAMAEELAGIREQLASLEGAVDGLAEQNERARVLAGLESIDAEVLQAGVGGPGTVTPRSHPLWGLDSLYSKEAFATSFDLTALQRRVRLLGTSLTEAADSLSSHREWLASVPSILPARGFISSHFSPARLHPVHHLPLPHEGIDISTTEGSAIVATANGEVTFVGRRNGYGLTTIIRHGFGYETLYGHASQILVRRGQKVERGEVIALVGRTGITTGPNVHYEVRLNGRPIDPHRFIINVIP